MKMILGRKLSMTQVHTETGMDIPLTIVQAGPCVVSQVKSKERDGYDAIQFSFGQKKGAHKPQQGHVAGLPGIAKGRGAAFVKELRLPSAPSASVRRGSVVTVESFTRGDIVSVTGVSKGRGFAGVVKRHHFHGHPTTHGHKDQTRMPGSIGSGGVQHVFRGQRMAGRMGGSPVTVHGLEIVAVDQECDILQIKGALPGSRSGYISIVCREGDMVFEDSNQVEKIGSDPIFEQQTTEQTTEAPPNP